MRALHRLRDLLYRLSGTKPVGILCEMTNDDGTMMRLPACAEFADKHGLHLINIEQMANFRQAQGLVGKLNSDNPVAMRIQYRVVNAQKEGNIQKHQSIAPGPKNGEGGVESMFKTLSMTLPPDDMISQLKVGVIRTCWNESLVKPMSDACKSELVASKVPEESIIEAIVPGSYELPYAAKKMAASGMVDVVVCFGVLLKGETRHFESVSRSVADGLMQVQLTTDIPVIYGVLNCLNLEQAKSRYLSSFAPSISLSVAHIVFIYIYIYLWESVFFYARLFPFSVYPSICEYSCK